MIGAIGGRRRSGSVSLIEAQYYTSGTTTATCTFSATPSDGEMLVAVVTHTGATPDVTSVPSGFSLRLGTDVNRTVRVYDKVASSESSASYTFTAAAQLLGVAMYRLSASSYATGGTNNATSATSLAAASSGLLVPNGSVAIASINLGGTGAVSWSNSFGANTSLGASSRGHVSTRSYTSGGSSENTTASWPNGRKVDSLLVVYKP